MPSETDRPQEPPPNETTHAGAGMAALPKVKIKEWVSVLGIYCNSNIEELAFNLIGRQGIQQCGNAAGQLIHIPA